MAKLVHSIELKFNDVQLQSQQLAYDGFFKLRCYTLKHRKFDDTMSSSFDRLVFERGDAVAVLPYDPITNEVVLVQQIRIGAYVSASNRGSNESPWLTECIAGMIESGEEIEAVAAREAQEEAGIVLSQLTKMMTVYTSPGGTSERVHLFAAIVDSTSAEGIHGLAEEHEDIRVLRMSLEQAISGVEQGIIDNAATVIAIQWLQLHKLRWLSEIDQPDTNQ